jgi:hypothetical protein
MGLGADKNRILVAMPELSTELPPVDSPRSGTSMPLMDV